MLLEADAALDIAALDMGAASSSAGNSDRNKDREVGWTKGEATCAMVKSRERLRRLSRGIRRNRTKFHG